MTVARSLLAVVVIALAACGRAAVDVAHSPEPLRAPDSFPVVSPSDDTGQVAFVTESDSAMADSIPQDADSVADDAALKALDELQVGAAENTATRARSVLGVLPVSGAEVAGEASGMFAAPRGGTASTAAPTYDIDVETFAGHTRVQAYVDYFLGPARDRFGIWLGRMARYEGVARDRFRLQGIPEDMVYLGLIESGFSNTAVSRSKAVGMWQFMAGTARLYGLKIDQWVDERRDPYKATDAAARLLFDLNGEFGSWYLAAAAYNAGSGKVSRGLRKLPKADGEDGSDSMFFRLSSTRYLKRETRDYVPKLIAAALIAKEPRRYGFDTLPSLSPLAYDEVSVSEQTGLDVIARLADTTTAALAELNPSFFRGVTPPRQMVVVRVPRGSGAAVAQRWAVLPANERVTVIDHMITRGETISVIAKRYHVDQAVILAANPRLRPRALRVGTRLVIPVSPLARANASAPRKPTTKSRTSASPKTSASNSRFHVVRFGESLWLIAQRYHVRVDDLRIWNDLTADEMLKPGVRLLIAPPGGGAADEAAESAR